MENHIDDIQQSKIALYQSDDGLISVDVIFYDETFWLTQKIMSELFFVEVKTVNEHLQSIYKSKELDEDSTIRNFRIVQKEGARDVSREIMFYNLDAIIAVGYRVNSKQATQFRRFYNLWQRVDPAGAVVRLRITKPNQLIAPKVNLHTLF